jgi:hypothetical protein
MSRSRKENERWLVIHPLHVERIDADLRERVCLEVMGSEGIHRVAAPGQLSPGGERAMFTRHAVLHLGAQTDAG